MVKGIFKGRLVTARQWYMPRRVYGRVVRYLGSNRWAIQGGFGLETFHASTIRPVKRPNRRRA